MGRRHALAERLEPGRALLEGREHLLRLRGRDGERPGRLRVRAVVARERHDLRQLVTHVGAPLRLDAEGGVAVRRLEVELLRELVRAQALERAALRERGDAVHVAGAQGVGVEPLDALEPQQRAAVDVSSATCARSTATSSRMFSAGR